MAIFIPLALVEDTCESVSLMHAKSYQVYQAKDFIDLPFKISPKENVQIFFRFVITPTL